jgi:hypothetical protein
MDTLLNMAVSAGQCPGLQSDLIPATLSPLYKPSLDEEVPAAA